jgi:hypothetical protein
MLHVAAVYSLIETDTLFTVSVTAGINRTLLPLPEFGALVGCFFHSISEDT